MSVLIGQCALCKEPVLDGLTSRDRGPSYPITGWEPGRQEGGANRVIDRQRVPGYVAHVGCVEARAKRRRSGISDGQESLL